MSNLQDGDVVIVSPTGQAGTIEFLTSDTVWVLLRSGEIWIGPSDAVRKPQSKEELDAAPVEVEKPTQKRKKRS